MPAPPVETAGGGLVGGKASPPPHHGGWEQTADHPPTQLSWRYAGEASAARVRGRHTMGPADAPTHTHAVRWSRRSSRVPWREAAIRCRPPTHQERRTGTIRFARRARRWGCPGGALTVHLKARRVPLRSSG
ncbi:hypothetical protein DLJ47_07445 [Micromonospora sp. S4605]|nr:hypothetical protein DLJ47_07445 [Micromonospora sp. S4605]